MATSPTRPDFSRARLRVILFVLVLVEINSAFEVGMMYGILATLMREFGDPVGVGWLFTGFLLVGAASAALGARLGDLFGRRRLALVMLACAALGSLISALSAGLNGLILGRALQGVAAAVLPLCIGLAREYFPPKRVPLTIGWLAAMGSFSAMIGIILGGWLADHAGWRTSFWIGAGHALLSILCVLFLLPPSRRQVLAAPLDVWGGVLFAPAVAAMLLAITRIRGSGLGDPLTGSLMVAGLLLLAAWVRRELRHPEPMLDVRLLGQRQVGLTMLLMTLFGLGASQLMLIILLVAQQPGWTGIGLGLSATLAALIKLPSAAASLIGAPWSGWTASRHGARVAAVVGAAGISLGWILLMFWHDTVWQLLALSFLATLAGAVVYAALPNLLIEAAPAERTSEVNGMLHVFRTVGTAIGTQMVTLMLASSTIANAALGAGRHPTESAYFWAFVAINICAALSVLVALALPRRPAEATQASRQGPALTGPHQLQTENDR